MGTITRSVVPGSIQNGTIASFNSSTGEFVFIPATDFIGTGRFDYEVFCDSGSSPVSLGRTRATIEIKCPGSALSDCLSPQGHLILEGDCIEAGDTKVMAVASQAGIINLYNKDKAIITSIESFGPWVYQISIPPANVWDAYYMTFTAHGKSESAFSNIVTVCPAMPKRNC
jgi:hypothetical protein